MMSQMRASGQNSTTAIARRNNTNWFARNENLIFARTQTSMEAIRSRQELATYRVLQQNNITSFDKASYIDAKEKMIDSNLLDRDFADAQQVQDFAVLDKAQRKVAISNAAGIGFAAWQGTVTPADPDGDLNVAFDAIDLLPVNPGDKQEIESEVKTRVENRRAESKNQAEQAEVQSVEQINERLNNRQFDGITEFINGLPLTETEKNKQIRTSNAFVKSINDADAATVTSDETNIKIDRLLNDVRQGLVTYDDAIVQYSELAKDVNFKEGEQNLDDIRSAADDFIEPVLKRSIVTRGQDVIERMRALAISNIKADVKLDDAERVPMIAQVEARALRNQTALDQWAKENKDDPDFNRKFQEQVNAIVGPPVEEVTLSWFQRQLRISETRPISRRPFGAAISELLGTQEEALAKKRFEALETQAPDLFRTLTDDEKESIRERFRRGQTVQEIIDLVQ